jgi:hypothetical protein
MVLWMIFMLVDLRFELFTCFVTLLHKCFEFLRGVKQSVFMGDRQNLVRFRFHSLPSSSLVMHFEANHSDHDNDEEEEK